MIRSFSHKGLERFFDSGDVSGIQPSHAPKLGRILDRLDAAQKPQDMNLPGFRLHPHKGTSKGKSKLWSVDVNGNWRVVFKFTPEGVICVDYCDPHS